MDITKTTPELLAALAAAQGEIENAAKNAKNPHFKSNYADLAEVLNTVRPVFSKHGLSVIQSSDFDGQCVIVTTVLGHASGGTVSSTIRCVPAKSDAQGVGACTTYLRRYSLAAMAGVAQEDLDGEDSAHGKPPARAASKPIIAPDQYEALVTMCRETDTDRKAFEQWLGVRHLAELPADMLDRAVSALQRKAAAMQKEAAA